MGRRWVGNIHVGKKELVAVEGCSHGLVFQDRVVMVEALGVEHSVGYGVVDEECKTSAALSSWSIPADKVITWKRWGFGG